MIMMIIISIDQVLTKNKKKHTCLLIEVVTPVDRNVIQKEIEKHTMIQDLVYRN